MSNLDTCNHQWDVSSPIDTVEICRMCGTRQSCDPIISHSPPPVLAPNMVLTEGDPNTELCQFCGSSVKKRFWCFGKILGCINERCENYYEINLKYR